LFQLDKAHVVAIPTPQIYGVRRPLFDFVSPEFSQQSIGKLQEQEPGQFNDWRICGSIIPGMRILPNPRDLKEAVRSVIESNSADGYVPSRFIQATGDGTAPDLLAVCRRLISKGETVQYLDSALKRISTLLTLEDLVSWRGAEWGFDETTIDIARARSVYFDQVAGRSRYGVSGDR
jgi:hypothetical protein